MKLDIKAYILIIVVVFLAMSMMGGKGSGNGSALGQVWANEMATSSAIVDQMKIDCAAGKTDSCGWGGFGQ